MKTGLFDIYNCFRQVYKHDNEYFDFFLNYETGEINMFYIGENKTIIIPMDNKFYDMLKKFYYALKNDDKLILKDSKEEGFKLDIEEINDFIMLSFKKSKSSDINYLNIKTSDEHYYDYFNLYLSFVGIVNNFNSFTKGTTRNRGIKDEFGINDK
jgi:hypothetical protein